ncbi:hypothetical protein DFJ58DRAFT_669456 [Suillus subalutaceus]|uniref:uncharacterized protein n=1 Tax=Suillus subalutaceus TaxID=48586 RepID=UPI001B876A7B|nr:uncharacterized protein DFJ58DRAFT_669456 [Suillus subalutaceus]KAG1836688.1 hypothetical protein DFJ58DRAFT_669456 [Suillus subalutaceus]
MTTQDTTFSIPSKHSSSALQMGPRKKVSSSNPLVSHGHHFGRMVFALCNYPSLLTNSILRLEQMEDTPLEDFSTEERWEHRVFEQLLESYPGLLERLKDGSEEEIIHIGELIDRGAAGARGDVTKTLKSVVLDWISPNGEATQPPLHQNSKIDRGFNHQLTGSLLCPAGLNWDNPQMKENLQSGEILVCGDQWPIFLYAHYLYDPEDPWCGLLRSHLLVCAYKHIFTSPSSVEREPKAMQSGNARLHRMKSVTIASIAYIATQVCNVSFCNTVFDIWPKVSSLVFSRTDPDESKEVDELLTWWNHQIFPTSFAAKRAISVNSALFKIRQKCVALKQATDLGAVSS